MDERYLTVGNIESCLSSTLGRNVKLGEFKYGGYVDAITSFGLMGLVQEKFLTTCKAAKLNIDGTQVGVVRYRQGHYGGSNSRKFEELEVEFKVPLPQHNIKPSVVKVNVVEYTGNGNKTGPMFKRKDYRRTMRYIDWKGYDLMGPLPTQTFIADNTPRKKA